MPLGQDVGKIAVRDDRTMHRVYFEENLTLGMVICVISPDLLVVSNEGCGLAVHPCVPEKVEN